ncbi:sigma-70 family RNA polymerase sigma factor [Aurantiacibacter sp. MUD11]|uniref:sigma-70 family RNA polymerase sigma factor n=1 Tax=Aurantiacibacter sp. MUD11 TaxID=3003265 RepID=UPI0022AA436A|nr:sigma-70 family RNA polymerase sigma factor [Aurantiacibacter sp. MUD11]WAT18154.1 sigma-70 family RNA polymerase sigma factor [Aurantiacibacter sp. MUD11]
MDEQVNTPDDSLDRLMAAAREGDSAAYRQFLGEAAQRIRARLASKIGANSELEDLVQESLIAIHQKRHTLDPGRPVAPWMYAIANYKLIDHWRKRGRSPIVLDDEADMAVPADTLAGVDVEALLDRLPEAQAEAIRLTHVEGLTNREAGERLGVGLSAMKLRVHRGMNALKAMVEDNRK